MRIISNCSCGSREFLVISKKVYEGDMENGALKCLPDNEVIIEIKCKRCQKEYDAKLFREISY